MKRLIIFISCLLTFGCAHAPMNFQLAPGTTQEDFQRAKKECGEVTGGGGFIFGPAIIVVGVVAVVESVKYAKKNKFQDCMEDKGFKCIRDCAHASTDKLTVAAQKNLDPKALDKWTETIEADQKKDWIYYTTNGQGTSFYYAPSSLSAEDQRYLYFREQVKFPPDHPGNLSYAWRSVKVNCLDKIFKLSDFAAIDKTGNTTDPKTSDTAWRDLTGGYPRNSFVYTQCEKEIAQGTTGDRPVPSLTQDIADKDKIAKVTSPKNKEVSRFIDIGNGTVTDTKTGLVWASRDNGSDIKWADAKSYCDNYRGGGYTDWRMPSADELALLYDASKIRRTACDQFSTIRVSTDLINITCLYLWTSETRLRLSVIPNAAYVYFDDGSRDWVRQSYNSNYRVLPVRSGR